MKCPKCGFENLSEFTACEQCGQAFVSRPTQETISLSNVVPISGPTPVAAGDSGYQVPDALSLPGPGAMSQKESFGCTSRALNSGEGWWKDELNKRVQDFRRRRATRLGPRPHAGRDSVTGEKISGIASQELDVNANVLLFSFEHSPGAMSAEETSEEISRAGADADHPGWDASELDAEISHPSDVSLGEIQLKGNRFLEGSLLDIALEAEVEPFSATFSEKRALLPAPVAGLDRRFAAGIINGAVLGLGCALFATIFWLAGGDVSDTPLNWIMGISLWVFFTAAYIVTFTALSASTPGLIRMGLEIRNFDGEAPTRQQAFWRGLGILVSVGSFLLGFIWALVDEERLTWHDRISDTFVVSVDDLPFSDAPQDLADSLAE